MIIGGYTISGKIVRLCCVVVFLCSVFKGYTQTKVFATTVVSSTNATSTANAVDASLTTRASLVATCPTPGGDAEMTLEFNPGLAANATAYIKIETQDALLSSLAQGNLGSLLGGLLGGQEFTVTAMNGATTILSGNSTTASTFSTERLRIVRDVNDNYFIRITPDAAYNRIKIVNKYNPTLCLGGTRYLYVYDAYTITGSAACGEPVYTSTSSTSILSLTGNTVTNPKNVLTTSTTDYSVLDMGLLGVGPSIEQTVYFEGPSAATDVFAVRLSAAANLISAGLATNVSVIASYQGGAVQTKTLSELLTLNLLTMTGGAITTVYMTPGAPVDRVTVRFSSFLSVGAVAQSLNFYGVTKTVSAPGINAHGAICSGSTASLTATTTTGTQIRWFTVASGGTAVATTNSGVAFVTPVLTSNTTYYAEQFTGSCTGIRVAVAVIVVSKPASGSISGNQTVCNNIAASLITSAAADTGGTITYRWESSHDEITWTAVSGATATTYQPPVLIKSTFFRRITINTASGISCESLPTSSIKITAKNCMVISNPMVRQRIKSGT